MRVDRDGQTIATNVLHERRVRKDVDTDGDTDVFYRVEIGGSDSLISLRLHPELISSSFTIEYWSHSNVTKEKHGGVSNCHYHGKIEGRTGESDIALS